MCQVMHAQWAARRQEVQRSLEVLQYRRSGALLDGLDEATVPRRGSEPAVVEQAGSGKLGAPAAAAA